MSIHMDDEPLLSDGVTNDYINSGSNHVGVAVDEALLFANADGNEMGHSQLKHITYRYYTLPKFRYTNVVIALILIDAITSVTLWLTGGGSQYFIDNIVHFRFLHSVFDLALLAALKVAPLICLHVLLESSSLHERHQSRYLSHALLIMINFSICTFVITKGSLVLHTLLITKDYTPMHATYNALVISSVVFAILQFVAALAGFAFMSHVRSLRVEHWRDAAGQEVDAQGRPIKMKVNLRRLISLAVPETGILVLATLFLIIASASQTAQPFFFGAILDAAHKSMADVNRVVLTLFFIYLVGALAAMGRSWLFTLCGHRLVARLRTNLFQHIIKQEVAFFDVTRTGELTNRLASDTQVLQNAVTVNMSMLVRNLLQIIASLSLLFVLNAPLTGVLLSVVPVVAIGAVQYGKFVKRLRESFQSCLADASTTAEETISALRTVRSFAGEAKSSRQYAADVGRSYDVGKTLSAAQGVFEGLIGLVANGAISLVLWYGGKLMIDGVLTAGVLTSFLLYTLQIAIAFSMLSVVYGDFMQAVGASVRIFELLDRKTLIPSQGGNCPQQFNEDISFEEVNFTYPSRPDNKVLHDISFNVSAGSVVALVGPSGGGKSTIVSLLERFYDPDSGRVLLGGHDLKSLDPVWFRRKIAMVGQEPTLFACSIKDNIAYGIDATIEQIHEASQHANAHDFISQFTDGYDTVVGERGVRLSGGQKQRVAIARALIMQPAILLLDEATSALDAESEYLVQEAIDHAMVNRTVLVIAHRLSTVRNASLVLVVDNGRIVEQGTHDELIAKNGVYKKLVLRQLMAGGAADEHTPEMSPALAQNATAEMTDSSDGLQQDILLNVTE